MKNYCVYWCIREHSRQKRVQEQKGMDHDKIEQIRIKKKKSQGKTKHNVTKHKTVVGSWFLLLADIITSGKCYVYRRFCARTFHHFMKNKSNFLIFWA